MVEAAVVGAALGRADEPEPDEHAARTTARMTATAGTAADRRED